MPKSKHFIFIGTEGIFISDGFFVSEVIYYMSFIYKNNTSTEDMTTVTYKNKIVQTTFDFQAPKIMKNVLKFTELGAD